MLPQESVEQKDRRSSVQRYDPGFIPEEPTEGREKSLEDARAYSGDSEENPRVKAIPISQRDPRRHPGSENDEPHYRSENWRFCENYL